MFCLTGNGTQLPNASTVPLGSPKNHSEAVAPVFRTIEQITSPEKEWYSKYLFVRLKAKTAEEFLGGTD